MGHYDSCYEAQEEQDRKAAKKQAKRQLKVMENLLDDLHRIIGTDGISVRHLEHLQDMMNETRVRASGKE